MAQNPLTGYIEFPESSGESGVTTPPVRFANATRFGAAVVVEAGGLRFNGVGNRSFDNSVIGTLNATGVLTAALALGGIVTSTTAAAVTGTTDTAALIVAAISGAAVGDTFDVVIANTGAVNAFTVAAGAGVTLLGNLVIPALKTGRIRFTLTNVGVGTAAVTGVSAVSA